MNDVRCLRSAPVTRRIGCRAEVLRLAAVGLWLVIAAGSPAIAQSDPLTDPPTVVQQTRTWLRTTLDRQLRQLDQNGLGQSELAVQIRQMRQRVDTLASDKMSRWERQLAGTEPLGVADGQQFAAEGELQREVLEQLLSERLALVARRRRVELARRARQLVESQRMVVSALAQADQLPPASRDLQLAQTAARQRTIELLIEDLRATLQAASQWNGDIALAAEAARSELEALDTSLAITRVVEHVQRVQLDAARVEAEELASQLFRISQLLDSASVTDQQLALRLQQLRAEQELLRHEAAAALAPGAAEGELVERVDQQQHLARKIDTLAQHLNPTSAAASRIERAQHAARQAAAELFARQAAAAAEAQKVVERALAEVEAHVTGQGTLKTLSAEQLQAEGQRLQQLKQQLDAALATVEPPVAADDPAGAAAQQKQAAEQLDQQLQQSLPAAVQQAVEAAQNALEQASHQAAQQPANQAASDEAAAANAAARQQLAEARAVTIAAMLDYRQRQLALIVAEVPRLSEVLERVGAQQLRFAEYQLQTRDLAVMFQQHQLCESILVACGRASQRQWGQVPSHLQRALSRVEQLHDLWQQIDQVASDPAREHIWRRASYALARDCAEAAEQFRLAAQRAAQQWTDLLQRQPSLAGQGQLQLLDQLRDALHRQTWVRQEIEKLVRPQAEEQIEYFAQHDGRDRQRREPVVALLDRFAQLQQQVGQISLELLGEARLATWEVVETLDSASRLYACHTPDQLWALEQVRQQTQPGERWDPGLTVEGIAAADLPSITAAYLLGRGVVPANPRTTALAIAGLPLELTDAPPAGGGQQAGGGSAAAGSGQDPAAASGGDPVAGDPPPADTLDTGTGQSGSPAPDAQTGDAAGGDPQSPDAAAPDAAGSDAEPGSDGGSSGGAGSEGSPPTQVPQWVREPTEAWFAELPAGVRAAIRTSPRATPPAAYRERLGRYFSRTTGSD
jgi:hypothetical protein